jgi:UDP-N-acetyl-D-mannosaminuronic acid transferase (WecB/TagA/CpsF family)
LLPDGVALQTFYRLASNQFDLPVQSLSNLNGTDFIPYFLDEVKKRFGSNRVRIYLYGSKPEIVEATKKRLEFK